jgi:tripartite-type tricarboxylate transporter receptor subunit TctC
MNNRRHFLAGSVAVALSGPARAQTLATRETLRVVCGFPAGGTTDTVARRFTEGATPTLARSAIVETKTGAGGQIAAQFVKGAAADGSTLLVTPLGILTTLPHTYVKLPYDGLGDFVGVAAGAAFDYAVGIGPAVPAGVRNVADLMKWCGSSAAHANFGSPATGTATHFLGVLLGQASNVAMTHVPYRGTPPAVLDMVGGQIPIVIGPLGEFLQFAKEGKCRILATAGETRSPFAPDVATLKEQGYPELVFSEWFAFFAPTGTPAATIDSINAQVAQALNKPSVVANFAVQGMNVQSCTPAELDARVRRDFSMWKDIVKKVGFTPQS